MILISKVLVLFMCISAWQCDGIETKARKVQLAPQANASESSLRAWRTDLGTVAERSIVLTAISAGMRAGGSCSAWNPFICIWHGLKEAGQAIAGGVLNVLGVLPHEKQAPLGGQPVIIINVVFGAAVLGILLCVGLGMLVDYRWPAPFGKGHPPAWVMAWLAASYALLAPGIICILFSFNIWASFTIFGVAHVEYNLTRDLKTNAPAAISESMLSFIHVLWSSGGRIGAILVIVYAVVIPCLKVLLLILAECWRNSTDDRRVVWSRRCIRIVQVVSKWASPDMFAYILILYLFRNMDHPPTLLATARLEIGFISFTLFCINSTFASMAIPLPMLPEARERADSMRPGAWYQKSRSLSGDESPPLCIRWFGHCGVKILAVLLAAGFAAGWGVGVFKPCMALKLELSLMHISDDIKTILKQLHFQRLIDADVSLWKCLLATASWLGQGEAATIMAFLLIGVFVMFLPCLDVLLLLVTAFTYRPCYILSAQAPKDPEDGAVAKRTQHWGMRASHYINHVQMLDVFAMGVVVVCAAGTSYKSQGILIMLERGMIWLIGAEVCHYALYYLVSSLCGDDHD